MEIKGYTLIREISRGPVTTVYLAQQDALEREVFLKVLNVHLKDEPDLLERFRREAKICARLRHPNVVSVFDFGAAGESFFIAMEYLEGRSLTEIIRTYHPLPFEVILFITRELARGLAYAHGFGVVHRDIKPANIMIEKNGAVKIADFGLATKADLPTVTIQHSAVGTPAYMSPEQARGNEVGKQSDLFSLGATIYELCSGRSPFLGETLSESVNKVLYVKPSPLQKERADIPSWFSQLVEQLLEKDAGKRLASAEILIHQTEGAGPHLTQAGFADFLENPESFSLPVKNSPAEPAQPRRAVSKKWIMGVLLLIPLLFVLAYLTLLPKEQSFAPEGGETTTDVSDTDSSLVRNLEIKKEEIPAGGQPVDNKKHVPVFKRETRNIPAPVPAQTVRAETSVKTELPATGRLMIICNPWAKIYLDGSYLETTPLSRALEVPAGKHTLELRNPNFQTLRQKIIVGRNGNDTLKFNMQPDIGFIMIQVMPWADVYLDDALKGTTPLQEPLPVPAGVHVLKLVNPNFQTVYDTLKIIAGDVIKKRVRLKK